MASRMKMAATRRISGVESPFWAHRDARAVKWCNEAYLIGVMNISTKEREASLCPKTVKEESN